MLNMLLATIVLVPGATFVETEVPGPDGIKMYRTSAALVLVGKDFQEQKAFEDSASTLEGLMFSDWKFPKENIRVRQVRSTEDARRELKWLEENTTDEDRVIVAYISHGVDGAKGPELDLALGTGRYRMDDASSDFAKVRARHKLLILDACRSGDATAGPVGGMETDAATARARRASAMVLSSDPGRDGRVESARTRFVEALRRETVRAATDAKTGVVWLSDVVPGKGLGFARLGSLARAESSQMLLDPLPTDRSMHLAAEALRRLNPEQEERRSMQVKELQRALRRGGHSDAARAVLRLTLAESFSFEQDLSRRRESLREALEELEDIRGLPDEYSRDLAWVLATVQGSLGELEGDVTLIQDAVLEWKALANRYPKEREPQLWAEVQNNLGVSLTTLGVLRGDINALREALIAFDATVTALPQEIPAGMQLAQSNLGYALSVFGELQGNEARLEGAITTLRGALKGLSRQAAPVQWANTQRHLGAAMTSLGWLRRQPDVLAQAVAVFNSALEFYTRTAHPNEWAATNTDLAAALTGIAALDGDAAKADQAVAATRLALEVFTQDTSPVNWVRATNNLGMALSVLSGSEVSTARLEQGIAAFRAVLEVLAPDSMPLEWAKTQNNLGRALGKLWHVKQDLSLLPQAATAFESALKVLTREHQPVYWATAQHNLGLILNTLGGHRQHAPSLEKALSAIRSSLEVYTLESSPQEWALAHSNIGNVLSLLSVLKKDITLADEGIKALDLALQVVTRETDLLSWARIQSVSGGAYLIKSDFGDRRQNLQKALERFRRAEGGYRQLRDQASTERMKQVIEFIEKALKDGEEPA